MLYVRVLGPISADIDGEPVDLGRRNQRAFVGILVAARGDAVSADRLIEELWNGRPPPRAIVSLQAYVSNLRRVLEPTRVSRGPATTLVRRSSGYALCLPENAVDAWRFEQSLAQARSLPADQARPLLLEILRWWQGPVFGESRDQPWAIAEASRLDELRLLAREQAIQAALRVRDHSAAMLEAQRLVRDEPLRPEACRLAALTLWAVGRESDSLEALRQHREAVRDEFGLDPAPALSTLEQAILNQRTELLHAETEPDRIRPAQLPLQLAVFTGRDAELAELTGLARASAGTVLVAVITGMGGVGKTALALRWAHQHQDEYPDGQLYIDLLGFAPAGEPLPPAEVLRGFLISLGVAYDAVPVSVPDRAALLRSMVNGRRMLFILDNARDADQVRDLIPGSAGCAVLITSRALLNDLVTMHHAHPVNLSVFVAEDSGHYLARRVGVARTTAEPDAVRAIVAVCGGLPLALAVVAARIVTNPTFTLTAIAGELRGSEGLDAFAAPGVSRDPRSVFSWSYRHLPAAAAALFRHLALHPGPDAGVAAAASLTGAARATVRTWMNHLVEAHLIREHRPGRFRFHDLLRAYAAELADGHDDAGTRAAVVRRSLDHYLHSAMSATALLLPQRYPITVLPPAPGVTPEIVATEAEALDWFDTEYRNLLAAVAVAEDDDDGRYCWQFNWAMAHYVQDRRARLDESITHLLRALALAEKHQDEWWIVNLTLNLARTYYRIDQRAESRAWYERGIELSRKSGDRFRLTQSLLGLAGVINGEHRVPDRQAAEAAHPYAREALEICRGLPLDNGRVLNEAVALGHVAWYESHQPNGYQTAVDHFGTIIDTLLRIDYRIGAAGTSLELGHLNQHAGATEAAIVAYHRTLELAGDVPELQAEALTGLVYCYRDLGDDAKVEEFRRAALAVIEHRHHPGMQRIRATLEASAR
ncbi:BTAD domain-containing putative transcriptional regulator [Actinoplanes sichuanensis]|uniref:BTAD domain-containing putative transcriptional regulator n=1 Tax=Actinoplanes sichuanensis TaxID=512349 RepID=A0ABW4AMG3_9ACTN|nr:BTAD domain-containing putative transcriptional regulator [Actinoplanes sichuanensis]BEL06280.1 BTAD domain-containing putative transcriptional regulator [Actinoplanes sichuanensis]